MCFTFLQDIYSCNLHAGVLLDHPVDWHWSTIKKNMTYSKSFAFQTVICTSAVIMVALCNRETIYIFILFLSSFFSSPNLSGRRLDVYHTLAHGVALVRI